ncbi:hypothetical protein M947_06835 [Sulfurimonas hongkongensis]|uniref:FAD-binding PCMH-type domain-containing protein n=1 Tax=Sulfurimonas hongkongensis TaxID=1172190 RepID=T0L0R7_9BACT|nr:FAD binding domain-containing protein [Sulfurimonas hongkongensis]EQB39368.1 hypothetical protein M947_06835 [Sulfurimonas hongkongensis]
MRNEIIFYLNGEKHLVSGEKVYWPLSRYIRECAGKTGTKVVCAEGDCGACTVLISNHSTDDFYSINSCISPIFTNDAKHIVTIEGLSLLQEGSNTISKALAHGNAAQCGFCSPGFVMSLADLFEHNKKVDEQMIKDYTTGNLCRCTGYVDIIKSALCVDTSKYKSVKDFFLTPKHIAELSALAQESLCLNFNARTVVIVTSLEELYSYRKKFPQAKLIASATDLGVLMNKGISKEQEFIFIGKIASLNTLNAQDDYINIGSNKTLTDVQKGLEEFYPEFSKFLDEFASPQIKNRATLVGNIANGSPIGDTLPFLVSIEAILVISSIRGTRELPIDKFYKAYKDFDLLSDEIITAVKIPKPKDGTVLKLYKVANRTHLDIATLSAAFYIKIDKSSLIEHLRIAYGGVAETVLRLEEIEKKYLDCSFTLETFEMIGKDISDSIKPLTDVRASAEFRKSVARNLLSRLYYDLGGL